jgi:hypothetical protein
VTLSEVATDQLVEKFDEISLHNNVADFEFGSATNSNSTTTWVQPRELVPEPSCGPVLPHEQFPFGLRGASAAYTEVLTPRRADKEIASEYTSDFSAVLDYNSDSYEFDFGLDSIEPEPDYNSGSYAGKLLSSPTAGLVIKSTPTGRFVYWPDQKPVDLDSHDNSSCIACLRTLPLQDGAPLCAIAEEHTPTEVATMDSDRYSPDR